MNIGKTLLFLNPLAGREPDTEGYRPRFGNRIANARALRPRWERGVEGARHDSPQDTAHAIATPCYGVCG